MKTSDEATKRRSDEGKTAGGADIPVCHRMGERGTFLSPRDHARWKPFAPAILLALLLSAALLRAESLPLSGQWRFELDPADAGQKETWAGKNLTRTVKLPGSIQQQGIGNDVTVDTKWTGSIIDKSWFTDPAYAEFRKPGNVKVPFWLQPEKEYVGAAWFQRDIEIPDAWKGRRIVLHLERVHFGSTLYIDGKEIGSQSSLCTPHEYDLSQVAPGKHVLTLRIDNRVLIGVGPDAHSVSDHTQGNWNGIVGNIELRSSPAVWIDDLQVYPDVKERSVRVKGRIGNISGQDGKGKLTLVFAPPATGQISNEIGVAWDAAGGTFEATQSLGEAAPLWSEFSPALHRLTAKLDNGDTRRVAFGLREIGVDGTQFTLNGKRIYIRGTLDCSIFPLTGYPPMDVNSWKRVIQRCQEFGLNHLRFHSYCPPEAAFIAADELGFFFQVEGPAWANVDDPKFQKWHTEECDRILRAYGNHPSFILFCYGNEPHGKQQKSFLGGLVNRWKAADPRRKYTSSSGWPQIEQNEFHVMPEPRIQAWGGGLKSRVNARPPETRTDYAGIISRFNVPIITHEMGQWCVYPNFKEMGKYTGHLKPRNFEIFRQGLAENHMLAQADDFVRASGKLQVLLYKEDIEANLRTPGHAGYQLLGAQDFPGQGTALVGYLDPFWDPKPYVTGEEARQFCAATVPLALLDKRVFTVDETFAADVKIAHFGAAPIENAQVKWTVTGPAGVIAQGTLPRKTIPLGNETALGRIETPLASIKEPAKLTLSIAVDGTSARNSWDIWVYPRFSTLVLGDVKIVNALDEAALKLLQQGGRVVLLIPPAGVKGDPKTGPVQLGFSSIFWNTAWTRRQPPHTLGILCDPKHPALASFPTEDYSNWQWWYIVSRARPMILDGMPADLRPMIQVVDDWVTNRRLALAFEAQVAGGKLLVCSADLPVGTEKNPVAGYLLHSLVQYAASDKFDPKVALKPEQIRALIQPPTGLRAHLLKATASSEESGYEAALAVDGSADTMWHSQWTDAKPGYPHELVLELKASTMITGFTVLPRQDKNRNGWVKSYELYISDDKSAWGQPAAKGDFDATGSLKTVKLTTPAKGKFVRLVMKSAFDAQPYGSLAEFDLVTAESGK